MRRAPQVRRWVIALAACLVAAASCKPGAGSAGAPAPLRPSPAAASYDLGRDERLGGHTLARHVGRSDRELADRLRNDRQLAAASSYTDRATAETVVAETLSRSRARVAAWLARTGSRPTLALEYDGPPDHPVGRVLRRGESRGTPASDALVVLEWAGSGEFFVLTSYPEVRR